MRRIWITEECHGWLAQFLQATDPGRPLSPPVGRKRGLVAIDLAEDTFEILSAFHIQGETYSDTLIRVAREKLGDKTH